jgi:transposase
VKGEGEAGLVLSVLDCIGLDAHVDTCTWTGLDVDGTEVGTETFGTNIEELKEFVKTLPDGVRVGIEASTAGKAVCRYLRENGVKVRLGTPRKLKAISGSDVKTDKRDSRVLAHLLQTNYFPESYVPPADIERVRQIVRFRMKLGQNVSGIKNQIIALVVKNLCQSRMDKFSDWFGKAALHELINLPFNDEDRLVLKSLLGQLKLFIDQEEELTVELAKIGEQLEEVRLLMTIPGIDFYSALAIVGEIGDVRRYPTKRHLCSDAGVVPRCNNSGDHVSKHTHVKHGNKVMKYFLCLAVECMIKSRRETNVTRFYKKKAKQIGQPKAKVAAARKLTAIIWKMLTTQTTYVDEDPALTERKRDRLERKAKVPTEPLTEDTLRTLVESIGSKEHILKRIHEGGPPE